MSEAKFRAILYVPDDCEIDEYYEDMLEMLEEGSIEQLISEAVGVTPEGSLGSPSLWVLDPALSERLVSAVNEDRLRKRAEREAKRVADVARTWTEKADRLRQRIVELESGEEIERLRRELEEAESASLAQGVES